MAKEYIERSIAITVADYAADEHPYKQVGEPETYSDYNLGWNDACDYIREKLENAQAADVAPVVHAYWDDSGRYRFERDGSLAIPCSNCGCALKEDEYKKYIWSYCPNCGAKMDGEYADQREQHTNGKPDQEWNGIE